MLVFKLIFELISKDIICILVVVSRVFSPLRLNCQCLFSPRELCRSCPQTNQNILSIFQRHRFVFGSVYISHLFSSDVISFHDQIWVQAEALKSQRKKVRNFTRLTVTTCLYLSPSNRARSLSTLIAVVVEKDTPLNTRHAVVKRIQRV